jgi:hypothetical protein
MNAGRQWVRAGSAEIVVLLGAGALLAACLQVARWISLGLQGHLGEEGPWATAFNTLALLALDGAVIAAMWRRPAMARVGATALLATLPCLPFLMPAHLAWLSEVRVGAFGDFSWGFSPTDAYPFLAGGRGDRTDPREVLGVLAALLVARLGAAALARSCVGTVSVGGALVGVSLVLVEALYASATRPPISRWTELYPVLASVRVRDVPRAPEQTGAWFSPFVRLARSAASPDDGTEILWAAAPPLADGLGGTLPEQPLALPCPRDETLILRRGPFDGAMLLTCGVSPPLQRTRWLSSDGPISVIEVHYWEIKVFNFQLVGRLAPPPVWWGLGVLALAASGVLLRGRRRPAPLAAENPYRSPLAGAGGRATDEATRVLAMRVGAVVIAVHGAAPLVMHLWIRLLQARSG